MTASGTRLSLALDGNDLLLGSSTEHLHPQILALSSKAPTLTFEKEQVTAIAASDYILGSQTLLTGPAVTVSGTMVSLDSNEASPRIGSSTERLSGSIVTETQSGGRKAHKTKSATAMTSTPNSLTGSFRVAEPSVAPGAVATGKKSAGSRINFRMPWWPAAGCALGVVLAANQL